MNKAEELIACLEGEIAKRDARLLEMDAQCMLAGVALDLVVAEATKLRAELAAIRAQEPVAWTDGAGAMYSASLMASLNISPGGLTPLYAAPVSEAKAQGVVQWPEADEIMQMAFEEGQPADDASGYCFELEEFDLFIERLMSEVANLNAAPVQQVSVPDGFVLAKETVVEMPDGSKELGYTTIGRVGIFNSAEEVFDAIRELDLPLGWVSMTTEQLLPGWMLAASPAAPAADAGHVFYGMDGNHP